MQPLRSSSARAARCLGLALLLATAGCGDSHPVVEPPSIDLVLSTTEISLMQEENATVMVSVARSHDYTRTVQLSVSGLPKGLSASFSPPKLDDDATTSQLTLTASAAVPAGTYTITVGAAGRGVVEQRAKIAVTVLLAPVFGGWDSGFRGS